MCSFGSFGIDLIFSHRPYFSKKIGSGGFKNKQYQIYRVSLKMSGTSMSSETPERDRTMRVSHMTLSGVLEDMKVSNKP